MDRNRFDDLVSRARLCTRCDAMDGRLRVLSSANGLPGSRIMLVGEAPGRKGAGRTGRPFAGDESGRRLDVLLSAAGWSRSDVFLTNSVLCNPLDTSGNNRAPTRREIRNCENWLLEQIVVVNPAVVVALGAVASHALRSIEHHSLGLHNSADQPVLWFGRVLAVRYHPGARAAIHRSVDDQLYDFQALGEWYRSTNGGNAAFQ